VKAAQPVAVTPERSSNLAYFIPGLPQITGDKTGLGWTLMLIFLLALVGCAFGLASGNAMLGFACLVLAGGSWIVSILTG